jgi:hypothetical protein
LSDKLGQLYFSKNNIFQEDKLKFVLGFLSSLNVTVSHAINLTFQKIWERLRWKITHSKVKLPFDFFFSLRSFVLDIQHSF